MPTAPVFDLIEPGSAPATAATPQFDLIEPGAREFDVVEPQSLEQLQAKFADLNYEPSDDEIVREHGLRRAKLVTDIARFQTDPEFRIKKGMDVGLGALKSGAGLAGDLVKGTWNALNAKDTDTLVQSVGEGVARGGRNFGLLLEELAKSAPGDNPMEEPLTADEKRQVLVADVRRAREEKRQSAKLATGKTTILPEVLAQVDPSVAEAVGLVADPTILIPGGVVAGKGGNVVLRRMAGEALEAAGRGAERAGEFTMAATKLPGKVSTAAAEALAGKGTEEAAALAPRIQRVGEVGTGVVLGAIGLANPATIPVVGAALAAGPATKLAGQAMRGVGRNMANPSFSHQLGLLGNIARDKNASEWLRAFARTARPLDPVLSAGGRAIEGAIEGAPIGAAIGGITGGEEGFTSGLGAGTVAGGFAKAAGGFGRGARRAAVDADLARWRSGLSPEAVQIIDHTLPGVEQQARVMNTQRFISGLGDVDFEYLTPSQWKEQDLGGGRALQTVTGDRPVVKVNLGKVGDGSPILHESGHVLRALFPEQFREIDRMLFSDFAVPEGKGTDFSTGTREMASGMLSAEQQQRLYDQYFSKLDRLEQEQRRSTWDRTQHLESLREEVTAEFLSSLLKDSPSDFLLKLGPGRQWLKDRLVLSGRRALIDKLPFLNRMGTQGGPSGSTLFSLDGKPLKVDARTAAQLRQVLRMRDRATNELKVADQAGPDDLKGATGVVRPAEMMGKEAAAIARIYGNSDTYAKDLAGDVIFNPDGSPVLLDEGGVRKLNARRSDVLSKALQTVSAGPADILNVNGRTLEPMTLQENGASWRGNYFTDAQLAAIEQKVGKDLVTPRQLADIRAANDAIKTGEGRRKALDYNPATREKGQKGKRGYASMGNKPYETVPLGFFINKEGGMGFDAFDVGSTQRKLARWAKDKQIKPQLAMWGGDTKSVEADIYKYIENQRQGRPNSVHLDTDPVLAVRKQRFITDLLAGERAKDALGGTILSTKRGKDNAWKSYRIDRLNQMRDSGGQDLPIQYEKVKANLMPDSGGRLPEGVSPGAVIRHVEAQAQADLASKLIAGGAPPSMASKLAEHAWKQAQKMARRKSAPHERAYAMRAGAMVDAIGPQELSAVAQATLKRGTDGAKAELGRQLQVKAIASPTHLQS